MTTLIEMKLREVSREFTAVRKDTEMPVTDLNVRLEELRGARKTYTWAKKTRPTERAIYHRLRAVSRRYGFIRRNEDLVLDRELEFAALRAERAALNLLQKEVA
jgi:hypothetical protein